MPETFRLCAVAIMGAILSLLLKQYKTSLAATVSLVGMCSLFLCALPYLKDVFLFAESLSEKTGLSFTFFSPLLKIIGITFLTECACAICKDAGESALATGLEVAGKLIILGISTPLLASFFEAVISVIP